MRKSVAINIILTCCVQTMSCTMNIDKVIDGNLPLQGIYNSLTLFWWFLRNLEV